MKKHYFYSIPCLALTCALAACSDDDKSSSAKAGQDTAGLTSAASPDPLTSVASDLVAKRAERLGIAALFPKDMGVVAGVYDIPGIMKSVQNLNMVKTWSSCSSGEVADESIAIPGEDAPEPVQRKCSFSSPVIDAMIGLGPEWAPWLDSAQSSFTRMGLNQMKEILSVYRLFQGVKNGSGDDDGAEAEAMGGQGVEMIAQWAELMDLRPSQAATAPVMIAAKLYEKTYNGLACKVAEVDCKKVRAKLEELLEEAKGQMDISQENMDRLKAALVRLDESRLYVAVSFVEDTLVGFITTNPEKQVRIASSPQDSVLSRPDFSMADARSQYPAYGLLFADKASVKGVINMDLAYTRACSPG